MPCYTSQVVLCCCLIGWPRFLFPHVSLWKFTLVHAYSHLHISLSRSQALSHTLSLQYAVWFGSSSTEEGFSKAKAAMSLCDPSSVVGFKPVIQIFSYSPSRSKTTALVSTMRTENSRHMYSTAC